MADSFVEYVVHRKATAFDKAKKPLLIAATVLALFAGLSMSSWFLIAFFALVVIDYIFFPKFDVEYEYTYVNGDIDIAAVYSKQSRKELIQISLDNVECIAPLGSDHLSEFGSTFKVIDFSAKDPANKPYVIVKGGEQKEKILVQMNDEMIADVRGRLPRKVFTD